MYTHGTTYKNLVLADANLVKDLKVIGKVDTEVVDGIFEDGVSMYDAVKYLVNVAADLTSENDASYDMAQVFYADTISVYAYSEELGEKYFDLLWKCNEGDEEAKAAFDELCKEIPDEDHYWVRRNV